MDQSLNKSKIKEEEENIDDIEVKEQMMIRSKIRRLNEGMEKGMKEIDVDKEYIDTKADMFFNRLMNSSIQQALDKYKDKESNEQMNNKNHKILNINFTTPPAVQPNIAAPLWLDITPSLSITGSRIKRNRDDHNDDVDKVMEMKIKQMVEEEEEVEYVDRCESEGVDCNGCGDSCPIPMINIGNANAS